MGKEPANSTEQNEDIAYTFRAQTKESCISVSVNHSADFTPIFPGILRSLDPEELNFGIWIKGSEEIIEYINPVIDKTAIKLKIEELLAAISRVQSRANIMVLKEEKKKLFDHLAKSRTKRLFGVDTNKEEQGIANCYIKLSDATDRILSFADQESVIYSEQVAIQVVESITRVETAASYLLKLLNHNSNIYEHGSLVALIALSIGKLIGVPLSKLRLIPLGCMYMDIGLSKLDIPGLFTSELSPQDLRVYERHPIVGVDLLNEMEVRGVALPEEVFQITLQHHERYNGRGFPNGKKGRFGKDNLDGINIFASIVGIADKFAGYFKPLNGKPEINPAQAAKSLNRLAADFDPVVLKVFNKLVNYSPQQEINLGKGVKWITEW